MEEMQRREPNGERVTVSFCHTDAEMARELSAVLLRAYLLWA